MGRDCNLETDECATINGVPPCANGGECVDLTQSYSCNCAAGYQGDNCALETDECRPNNPCQNGGACTDEFLSFTCVCEPGYGGELCETNLNECDPSPCQHGGLCLDLVALYRCDCVAGYSGRDCETNVDDCTRDSCANGGRCEDGVQSYSCKCTSGWEGDNCEQDMDECGSVPCLNTGSCTDGFDSYTCTCTAGWAGDNCAEDIDECASSPCPSQMDCVDGEDAWDCSIREVGSTSSRIVYSSRFAPPPAAQPEESHFMSYGVPLIGGVVAMMIVIVGVVLRDRRKLAKEQAEHGEVIGGQLHPVQGTAASAHKNNSPPGSQPSDGRLRLADGSISEFDVESSENPLSGDGGLQWEPIEMPGFASVQPGHSADGEDEI